MSLCQIRKMALSSVSVIPGFHFRLFVSNIFTYNVSHFRQALPNINDMLNRVMNIFVEHESVSDMLPDMTIPDDTETHRDVTIGTTLNKYQRQSL
jgi:hypothetical protein